MSRPAAPLTALDLFCGCGGFTLGLQRAGFRVLAAIDFNPEAIATLRANLVEKHHPGLIPMAHAIEADLTRFPPERLAALLRDSLAPSGGEGRGEEAIPRVDVIVGGPPCQGFSTARQRDGANHGHRRLIHDPRRLLYCEFLRYVAFFRPRVFVMENVLGIRSAAGGEYLTRVQKEARELGYRVHGQIEDAWELGVPQKRRRQLFIGVRLDVPGYFLPHLRPAPRVVGQGSAGGSPAAFGGLAERPLWAGQRDSRRAAANGTRAACAPHFTLWDALGDLPPLRAGGGQFEADYDFARRCDHVERRGEPARRYLVDVLEIDCAEKLTNHVARPHSERDLRDFAQLREGENSATAMRERRVEFEFPYDKSSFKDRYTRQHRERPCSTIVAHLSKDGLMFIHPTQNRSLTPREAARVQSFPDWFVFPRAQTHAFRLIGNAVPPLVAEAVGLAVKEFLENTAAPTFAPRALAEQTTRPARKRQGAAALQDASRESNAPDGAPAFGVRQSSGAVRGNTAGPVLPARQLAAAEELVRLARLDRRQLRRVPTDEFLRGWRALLSLCPHLHPDNARDHGTEEEVSPNQSALPGFEALFARRYARSGWPVALAIIGEEAWRRLETGEICLEQFYNANADCAELDLMPAQRGDARRTADAI
ncbi:MAG: DNA cytosine methyltransferase [Limisphaerales bacterium]